MDGRDLSALAAKPGASRCVHYNGGVFDRFPAAGDVSFSATWVMPLPVVCALSTRLYGHSMPELTSGRYPFS